MVQLTPLQKIVVIALQKGGRLRILDRRKTLVCTLIWKDGSRDQISMRTISSLLSKGVIYQRPVKTGDVHIDYKLINLKFEGES